MRERTEELRSLAEHEHDLLVIGGGATGAGIARDAALRGLDVVLVEREDIASGTSSRSSRLIHGGIRYLEHGHLKLVFEASAERRRLLALAPHLVRPLAFTWPVYEGARVPRWKLGAGLMLYDALSLFRNVGRHRRLSAQQVMQREPALERRDLRGGAQYHDAATDDARLTLATALDAREAGAAIVTYAEVRELLHEGGRVRGARVHDVLEGSDVNLRARIVVNAAGPWSDAVRRLDEPSTSGPAVRGSTGAHILVPRERVGNHGALTLVAPQDGRVFFVLPSGAHTLIGTTETETHDDPGSVRATERDVRYLLDAANAHFPRAGLTRDDVISAWAGIRPLVAQDEGEAAGEVSREHAISTSRSGLVSITGGKLTTYRVMAEQVVELVLRRLGRSSVRTPTADRVLPGGEIASVDVEITATIAMHGLSLEVARHLVEAYGARWRAVLDCARELADGMEPLAEGLPYVVAELAYGVRHEMARTIGDLLIRRTHVAFETRDQGASLAARVADVAAPLLGWSEQRRVVEMERFAAERQRMFSVAP